MPITEAVNNIFAICVKDRSTDRIVEFRGTGFFIRPKGYFLTAQHVMDRNLGPREGYFIVIEQPYGSGSVNTYPIVDFEREPNGFDLVIGRAAFDGQTYLPIARSELSLGDAVYSYGFAMSERERRSDGFINWRLSPRYFQGYYTRDVSYDQPGYRTTPTYEVSFPAPEGLSGSPLLVCGTHKVAGLIYGNFESYTIASEREIEQKTGTVIAETRRLIQFGLAHFHTTLLKFKSRLLNGKSIEEWQP